jgi:hypothetical protein
MGTRAAQHRARDADRMTATRPGPGGALRGLLVLVSVLLVWLPTSAATAVASIGPADGSTPEGPTGAVAYRYDGGQQRSLRLHAATRLTRAMSAATRASAADVRGVRSSDAASGFAAEAAGGGERLLWTSWQEYPRSRSTVVSTRRSAIASTPVTPSTECSPAG